jgi:hypothetical protein
MKKLEITDAMWEQVSEFNKGLLKTFMDDSIELSTATRKTYESNLRIWFYYVFENLNNAKQIDIKPLQFLRFQNWLAGRECSSSDISN